jgi:glycosyltransferase involved in cell wall biosynthesis
MAHLATRRKQLYPYTYKGFHLVRNHGRVYGVPTFLDLEEVELRGRLISHPAILSAATREELEAHINGLYGNHCLPEVVDRYEGYDLVRHRGSFYGVPQAAGFVDLDLEEERRRVGALGGHSVQEVKARIRAARDTVPVEFAGWLPVFERAANCGQHPQFTHTAEPPPGYRFTYSAPPPPRRPSRWLKAMRCLANGVGWLARRLSYAVRPYFGVFRGNAGFSPRARLRVLGAVVRLFFRLVLRGARIGPVLCFLRSRHYQSQVMLGNYRGLVFLTSMPFTYGQNPWVVEIEDPTTLFNPLIHNGLTGNLQITQSPFFPVIKALLESDHCKGILTHMKSTAALVPTLFGSDKITAKVSYAPLGIQLPRRRQRHEESEHLHLVFINSWNQLAHGFYVRGGLDILEAFAILHERYPQLRLTLRSELPVLDPRYHRILEQRWVRVINRFLPADEMEALLAGSHIFLLPAARVHSVSLLQAMACGLAVVTSDGWGIDEYITHERNGLVVKGRYGKVSWADEKAGMLCEDYEPMFTSDRRVVDGVVEAVSRLVEDRELRQRLGRTARRDVETTFNLENWNRGLKAALDKALAPGPGR